MVADIAGDCCAERGADAHCGADYSLRQIVMASAAHDIGENEGTSTPRIAADMPSSSWTAITRAGSLVAAKEAQRTASAKRHSTSRGRLPQLSALRPMAGAMATTTNCGAKMHTERMSVAVWGSRAARRPAMIGSAAALPSWNRNIFVAMLIALALAG